MALISVRNVTYEYTHRDEVSGDIVSSPAVFDVSFDIEKGSFVAIVGMNGSGKSTLAKTLNALLIPTSGDVVVDDMNTKDQAKIWDIRCRVGMVFQNPDNQIVSSIVEDDIAFGPENLGIPPALIRERVDTALKAVNMFDVRKKAPHMLSGGQKQRIAIAGVVAMRPTCIVFDEPTAMLDPDGRRQVMNIIKKLNGEGITTILITHFMEEAIQADRVIVMKSGKIYSDGTPEELFSSKIAVSGAGLELPPVIDMRERLINLGYDISRKIMSEEELVNQICQ